MPKRGAFALLLTAGALAFLISFKTPDTATATRPGRVAIATQAPGGEPAAGPDATGPGATPAPSTRPGRGGQAVPGGGDDPGFPPEGGFSGDDGGDDDDDGGFGAATPEPGATATPRATQRATTGALKDGTYTGDSVRIRWGSVQVQVTVSGGKVTEVTTLDMPYTDRRTRQITDVSEPVLREQVLETGSADVDMISGATYTCRAYAQSAQSALDQAAK